jgi:hypothetical protein
VQPDDPGLGRERQRPRVPAAEVLRSCLLS